MSEEYTDEQIEDVEQALFARVKASLAEAEHLGDEAAAARSKLSASEQKAAHPFIQFRAAYLNLPTDHLNELQLKYLAAMERWRIACQDQSFTNLMTVSRKHGNWRSIVREVNAKG